MAQRIIITDPELPYCVKCRAKRELVGGAVERLLNGTWQLVGSCGTCGAEVRQFVVAGVPSGPLCQMKVSLVARLRLRAAKEATGHSMRELIEFLTERHLPELVAALLAEPDVDLGAWPVPELRPVDVEPEAHEGRGFRLARWLVDSIF